MKPSGRFKKRYISFLLSCISVPLPNSEARDLVHTHFLSYFGEQGVSSLAFKLVKYDEKTGKGMVRCERSRVDEAILCMACFTKWKGSTCRMEPITTSGSVKRAGQ